MHGCPYCESFKTNEANKKTNQRGKYKEVNEENGISMRTWRNLDFNSESYRINGEGIRNNLQKFKNVEHKAITVKKIENLDEEVILTFPPEPLHHNILGPGNDGFELLERLHPEEIKSFCKK